MEEGWGKRVGVGNGEGVREKGSCTKGFEDLREFALIK